MSTRGAAPGLVSPFPLGQMLPSLYQGDEFSQRFTAALDTVIGPIINTIDCFDAYLDPAVAPPDFAEWLASWVGLVLDDNWPLERQRALVTKAVELYSWQGTLHAVREVVTLYAGVVPEVTDSGGVVSSEVPGAEPPGSPRASVLVTLRVGDPSEIDRRRVLALVEAVKPAHVLHDVEVVRA